MNTQTTLSILKQIEQLIDSARPTEPSHWQRDKIFISAVRERIVSEDPQEMRWAFDQLRNLSQSFGAYCGDLQTLDNLLDDLQDELKRLILAAR